MNPYRASTLYLRGYRAGYRSNPRHRIWRTVAHWLTVLCLGIAVGAAWYSVEKGFRNVSGESLTPKVVVSKVKSWFVVHPKPKE